MGLWKSLTTIVLSISLSLVSVYTYNELFIPSVDRVAEQNQDTIVAVEASNEFNPSYRGIGSGVIISPEGDVLTCAHVVEGRRKYLRVAFWVNGKKYTSKVKVTNISSKIDLATVKMQSHEQMPLPYAKIAYRETKIGEEVVAIGNPFGLERSVTFGVVSALERTVDLLPFTELVQTDVVINPGSSGGGLFDMDGNLIGITNILFSVSIDHPVFAGHSFSIPRGTILFFLRGTQIKYELATPTGREILWDYWQNSKFILKYASHLKSLLSTSKP